MSGISDVISYLTDFYTQSTIAQTTGIPQSTLSYVTRGLRDLPEKYHAAVYAMKNTTAYSQLFNLGVPPDQAALISLEPVASLSNRESYLIAVADKLTVGYIESVSRDSDEQLTDQQYIDKYYESAHRNIIDSLRRSTKPIDEWDDYLSGDDIE